MAAGSPQFVNLSEAQRTELTDAARAAADRAYAPYSHFPVGAAVLDDQGRIFTGCNVENVSFGLTICAERNAVAAAVNAGAKAIQACVVWTPQPRPTPPCGACRQVLAEFGPKMPVRMECPGGTVTMTLDELLPAQFTPEDLP